MKENIRKDIGRYVVELTNMPAINVYERGEVPDDPNPYIGEGGTIYQDNHLEKAVDDFDGIESESDVNKFLGRQKKPDGNWSYR